MQLRIHWREKGLNPDIAAKVKVDPLTYKECSEMTKHNLLPVLWMHMRLLLLLQLKRRGHILPISALAGLQLEGVTSSFELQQQKKPHVHPEHRQQIVLCHLRALLVAKPATPDWLWSEERKLLPTVFQEVQALCGREFTLDAAATDSGSFDCSRRDEHVRVDAPISLDSGATSNFVSPRLLKQLAVNYSPSSATSWLADAFPVPFLDGRVQPPPLADVMDGEPEWEAERKLNHRLVRKGTQN
ncbi:TPA: hypothetical protein ACH3X2_000661 [Trebouxia sp. C0005]